jgi:phosphatidylserine decarboxylase
MNVGSISTAWAGEVLPRKERSIEEWDYAPDHPKTRLDRGEFLGQFNMGSTVILLLPRGAGAWRSGLTAGSRVLMGSSLGRMDQGPHGPTD